MYELWCQCVSWNVASPPFPFLRLFRMHAQEAGLPVHMCPYAVIATGPDSGFIVSAQASLAFHRVHLL